MAFLDGSRITPGTEKCKCDTDGRSCEFPCWQRIGLTTQPCCPDCAPLVNEDVQLEAARRDPRGLGDGCGRE